MGYLEWRVGLLMVGYYVACALVTREQTTRKRLAYFCLGYVLTLTALSLMYALVLLVNSFRFMTILHLCLGVVLVEYTLNGLLNRQAVVDRRSS